MSPKQSSSLLEQFRVNPRASQNNFINETAASSDPYNVQFSKTDASAMSNALKSGSIDFGDLKSGGSSNAFGNSPGYERIS
jgi:hypothetical protein